LALLRLLLTDAENASDGDGSDNDGIHGAEVMGARDSGVGGQRTNVCHH
jgi:hypothetical protein